MVGVSATFYELTHAHGRHGVLLGKMADQLSALFGPELPDLAPENADPSFSGFVDCACKLEKGRLSASIRANDAGDPGFFDVQRQPFEKGAVAIPERYVVEAKSIH